MRLDKKVNEAYDLDTVVELHGSGILTIYGANGVSVTFKSGKAFMAFMREFEANAQEMLK